MSQSWKMHKFGGSSLYDAKARRMTPAMAAGLTDKLMDMKDIAAMIEDAAMRATIQRRVATLALPQSN